MKDKHGQIKTRNINALREYAETQPRSSGIALNLFIDWQTRLVSTKVLSGKKVKLYHDYHSYGLKHCVERLSEYLKRHNLMERTEYCGNEEFIIAMMQAGFDCDNSAPLSERLGPNYVFNIVPLKTKRGNYGTHEIWMAELARDMFGIKINERY